MTLSVNIDNLATAVATAIKSTRMLVNNNAADLAALTTTDKTNLVAALNEVKALVGGGSPTTLDDLTDVVITAAALGDIIRHNGTNWVDVDGTTIFATAAQGTLAGTAVQPARSISTTAPLTGGGDLSANRTLAVSTATATTTGVVELATDAETTTGTDTTRATTPANVAAAITARVASLTAAGIVELATTAEATAGTDATRAVTPAGLQAGLDALIAAAPGTLNTLDELAQALGDDPNFATTLTTNLAGKQPLATPLTTIAGLAQTTDNFIVAVASAWASRTPAQVKVTLDIGDTTTNFVTTFNAGLV